MSLVHLGCDERRGCFTVDRDRQWMAIEFLSRVFKWLPHGMALRLGAFLGWLLWFFSKSRVDRAEARCVGAMGIGPTDARRIVRESYINHGRCVAEFVRLPLLGHSLEKLISVTGMENLERAFSRGKGVILLSAHIGNWEVAAALLARRGFPMNAIGAEQRDPRVTDLIVSTRARCGIKGIGKGFSLKSALSCLRKGEVLCILLDQDAKDKGVVVPFLGAPASTPYGPVKIASKLGASVVPVFSIRRGKSSLFDLRILPPIEMPGSDASEESFLEAVTRCNDCLSQGISKNPEQWMWLYPRWASTLGEK